MLISLLHNKNLPSSAFKPYDSQVTSAHTLNQHSPLPESPRQFHFLSHRISPTKRIHLPDTSARDTYITESNVSINCFDDKNLLPLPSPKTKFLKNSTISITKLYSPTQTDAPTSPTTASEKISPFFTRFTIDSPEPEAKESLHPDDSRNDNLSVPLSKFSFPSKPKKDVSIEAPNSASPNKFKSYLNYLDVRRPSLNKVQFQRRLKKKFPENPAKKSPEPVTGYLDSLLRLKSNPEIRPSIFSFGRDSSNNSPDQTPFNSYSPKDKKFSSRVIKDHVKEEGPELRINHSTKKPKPPQVPKPIGHCTLKVNNSCKVKRSNEVENTFRELASNLQDLYQLLGNEKKVVSELNKLGNYNSRVMAILSPKFHHVSNFNAQKLEQKFAIIEVSQESVPSRIKLLKMEEGSMLIDNYTFIELDVMNKKIEEYIVAKKKENLKYLEEGIEQSQMKLEEFRLKEMTKIRRRPMQKQNLRAQQFLTESSLPIHSGFLSFDEPVEAVDKYQKLKGGLHLIKRKNLEHAKGVNETYKQLIQKFF